MDLQKFLKILGVENGKTLALKKWKTI